MVIEDGKVTLISTGDQAIPEDGYVINLEAAKSLWQAVSSRRFVLLPS